MSEKAPRVNAVEYTTWRVIGALLLFTVLKLLSKGVIVPTNTVDAIVHMTVGLTLPAWAIWGHIRGLLRKFVNNF